MAEFTDRLIIYRAFAVRLREVPDGDCWQYSYFYDNGAEEGAVYGTAATPGIEAAIKAAKQSIDERLASWQMTPRQEEQDAARAAAERAEDQEAW